MNSNLIDHCTGLNPVTTSALNNTLANAKGNPVSTRRLQLVWSIKREPVAVIRVAFATTDRVRVNQHFGAAEGFAIYDVVPDKATLVGVAEFADELMDGNEGKLSAKVEFLDGCNAVYVTAIGASAIKQLTARGIQPIRINEVDHVDVLLHDIARAMSEGGVSWIDRAIAAQAKSRSDDRFAAMEEEGWEG